MRISDWSSDVCSSDLEVYDRERPDRIVVHGDTLTTMVATLAAYFRKIPVAHVEAGLRRGDIHHPWPEEVNRMVVACMADLNFEPTKAAANALLREIGRASGREKGWPYGEIWGGAGTLK